MILILKLITKPQRLLCLIETGFCRINLQCIIYENKIVSNQLTTLKKEANQYNLLLL